LRIELSDVCPCTNPACTTPHSRWDALTKGIDNFKRDDWARYRDEGRIDFGRGFMGFEVVRSIVEDLKARRIFFGELSVTWRGEPLLHPEAHPILVYLLNTIANGHVAERLVIETNALFLTDSIAQLTSHPAPQLWILNGDQSPETVLNEAERLLRSHRHQDVNIWRTHTATEGFDPTAIHINGTPVFAGEAPPNGDAIWMRRENHGHYLADQRATHTLLKAAEALGIEANISGDNRPTANAMDERSPTISWDGKVTMSLGDTELSAVEGDVVHSTFSSSWSR